MQRTAICIVTACLILVSGCSIITDAERIQYTGDLNASGDRFHMEGTLVNSAPVDPATFENVTVYLYAENGTVLQSQLVGTLRQRENVSISSDTVPEYVVFDSPDFWSTGFTVSVTVSYYEQKDGLYMIGKASSRTELPVDVPPNESSL